MIIMPKRTFAKYTLVFQKKTCDYVFDDKLNYELSVYNNFWHTYYEVYFANMGSNTENIQYQ